MNLTTRNKVIIVVIYTAVVAATGAYLVPTKTKIETKIVEVEKKVDTKAEDAASKTHKVTTIVVVTKPDGEKNSTTTISYDNSKDTKTNSKDVDTDVKQSDTLKEVTRGDSKVTISALGGVDFSRGAPIVVYGASVTKPILGPIACGVWGLTNGVVGASIGLTF